MFAGFWLRVNRPKLYGNCAFPQNSHTRRLGEITVFYAVSPNFTEYIISNFLYRNNKMLDGMSRTICFFNDKGYFLSRHEIYKSAEEILKVVTYIDGIYLFKVSNRNTRNTYAA